MNKSYTHVHAHATEWLTWKNLTLLVNQDEVIAFEVKLFWAWSKNVWCWACFLCWLGGNSSTFFFPSSLKFLNSNTLCWSRNPLVTNTNLLEQRAGLNLKFEEKRGVTHALTDQSKYSYYPKHENLKKMELESVWNGVAATHNSLEEVISELTSVTTPRSNSDWLTSLGSW